MKLRIFLVFICIALTTYLIYLLPTFQKKDVAAPVAQNTNQASLTDQEIVNDILPQLNDQQQQLVIRLDSLASIEKIPQKTAALWHHLAIYCYDSISQILLYYLFEYKSVAAASNETYRTQYATHLMQQVFSISQPIYQQWFAQKAKSLWLISDTTKDSVKISILACDLLGNLSTQPMQTVGLIQQYTLNKSTKTYANFILGLAGKKTGQFMKAIKRFLVILHEEPKNMDIVLNLAECYELDNRIDSSLFYYQRALELSTDNFLRKTLKEKITSLKNHH